MSAIQSHYIMPPLKTKRKNENHPCRWNTHTKHAKMIMWQIIKPTIDTMKNQWDKIHSAGAKYKPLNELFLDLLLSEIKKRTGKQPKTAIDLGCGTGDSLIKLRKRGLLVTGIDVSAVALKRALTVAEDASFPDVQLIKADLNHFTPKDTYDFIICHLTYAFLTDKRKFLQKVREMMSHNSTFALITPVLHKRIKYIAEDKPHIAVDYQTTLSILKKQFSHVVEFHHDYFAERGDNITFILQK